MRQIFCIALLSITISTSAQGVKWVEGLSWQQVLQKAKQENKFLFVDFYTTWCGPCKVMDKNVYPNAKVGDALNEKFISIKVQMDKTNNDNEFIKSWYTDAKLLEKDYKIKAYPTLLFFNPNGDLVHRLSAGLNVDGFLDLVSDALDSSRQYYKRIENYKNGNANTSVMRELAIEASKVGDKKLAAEIADKYMRSLTPKSLKIIIIREFVSRFSKSEVSNQLAAGYINILSEREIYTKDNIEFIRQFTKSSNDRGFKIFYNNPKEVNMIMDSILPATWDKNVYAQDAVQSILYDEYVVQKIFRPALASPEKVVNPDWNKLKLEIQRKFSKADVNKLIVDAKYFWYKWKKGPEYLPTLCERMDILYKGKNLAHKQFDINNLCWEVFLNSGDVVFLNKAIRWMEEMFVQSEDGRKYSQALDTYANLLYRVGRVKEALEWEQKALALDPNDEGIKSAWVKMNKGLPTWPQN